MIWSPRVVRGLLVCKVGFVYLRVYKDAYTISWIDLIFVKAVAICM